MSRVVQPLKWHGGKHYLAPWIHSIAPPHKHRVYLYAGGLGEAWNWPSEGVSEVANDVNGYLLNFYRTLQHRESFDEFHRIVSTTPFSRREWESIDELMRGLMEIDPPDEYEPRRINPSRAAMFFIWNRQSMSGRMDCFSPLTRTRTRGGRNAEVNAWWNAIEGLPAVRERLDRMVIEHFDAIHLIGREDGPDTLFYADPPYTMGVPGEGRSTADVYQCEVDDDHHRRLADRFAAGVKGKVILSGYRNAIYDERLTPERGWVRLEREIDNKAARGKAKRTMVECLWCNFTPEARS